MDARTLELAAGVIDLSNQVMRRGPSDVRLSTLEVRLLAFLAERPGQDVSRDELLREVWGYSEGVLTRAVDTVVKRLRSKIELDPSVPRHLITVWGCGYRFEPLPPQSTLPSSALPSDPPLGSVPTPGSRFVGRQGALAALDELVEASRLVTLTGPGGVGKTRLALHHALDQVGRLPGGAWFCDLTEARDLAGVCTVVAQVLGLSIEERDAVDQIGSALRGRGALLLVLDNVEQLVAPASTTISRWLEGAPRARFLVTSRERLRIDGETPFELGPMDAAGEGLDLFLDRAARARPGFQVSDSDRPEIIELISELDGLPLAIELAAARANVLRPADIRQRLGQRFEILGRGARGTGARHATLRGTLDWSWALLEPWERTALAQLSVFRGGFALADAEAVLDLGGLRPAPPAIDLVQSLREKSLLAEAPGSDGRVRFDMLLCVRDYAAEHLDDDTLVRHALQVLASTEPLAAAPDAARSVDLLREWANLEAIRERFAGHPVHHQLSARAARAASPLWVVSRPWQAHHEMLCQAIVDAPDRDRLRMDLLMRCADLRLVLGIGDGVRDFCKEALELADEHADRCARGDALLLLSKSARLAGEREQARTWAVDAMACYRQCADTRGIARATHEQATESWQAGDLREARELLLQSLALFEQVGAEGEAAKRLADLAHLSRDLGELPECRRYALRGVELARRLGEGWLEGQTLGALADAHREAGQLEEARQLYAESLALVRAAGVRRIELIQLGALAHIHEEEGDLERAEQRFVEVVSLCSGAGYRWMEGLHRGNLGMIRRRRRLHAQAVDDLDRGVEVLAEVGEHRAIWYFRVLAACSRAALDPRAIGTARAVVQTALAALVGPDGRTMRLAVEAEAGHLDLLAALQSMARGEDPAAWLARAQVHLDGEDDAELPDLRTARRWLREELERTDLGGA